MSVLTTCALTTSVCGLSAQTRWEPDLAFGVHGGAGASKIFFSPGIHEQMRFGPTAGLAFRYSEENHFGLIAELNFTQRGWKEDFRTYTQFSYSRALNYLELPVLAHIYFGRRSRFFINLGPQISYMISDGVSANFDYKDYASVKGFPLTGRTNAQLDMEVTKRFDYGICAGLGGEWRMLQHHSLTFEARFYYGLGNCFPSARTDIFHSSNAMFISATIGYWFNFKTPTHK